PLHPLPPVYSPSLHDALPISPHARCRRVDLAGTNTRRGPWSLTNGSIRQNLRLFLSCIGASHSSVCKKLVEKDTAYALSSPCHSDRKSTRLNSSHEWISYDVF